MDISGAMDQFKPPWGGWLLVTGSVAAWWIGVTLECRVRRPVATLAPAWALYAGLTIILLGVTTRSFTLEFIDAPALLVSPGFVFGCTFWGAAQGGIAAGIAHFRKRGSADG